MWGAAKKHVLVAAALVVFVAAHSLVPHKEDRFLFPVLPLLFVLLGSALAEIRSGGRWSRRAFAFFWSVNAAALIVTSSSDAYRNLTVPLSEIREKAQGAEVLIVGTTRAHVPAYYLGGDEHLRTLKTLADFSTELQAGIRPRGFVLFWPGPSPDERSRLDALGLGCGEPTIFQGDVADRVMVLLNPEHNRRRQATALFDCRDRVVASCRPSAYELHN
jgi:hypothetical protein